jgi:hypothetical protein
VRINLKKSKEELRRRIHQPTPEQGDWLRQVVTRFFNCHSVPTNIRVLASFRCHLTDLSWRSLMRRSSGTDSLQGLESWLLTGSLNRKSCMPGQVYALPSNTQGERRMREFRLVGLMRWKPAWASPTGADVIKASQVPRFESFNRCRRNCGYSIRG